MTTAKKYNNLYKVLQINFLTGISSTCKALRQFIKNENIILDIRNLIKNYHLFQKHKFQNLNTDLTKKFDFLKKLADICTDVC